MKRSETNPGPGHVPRTACILFSTSCAVLAFALAPIASFGVEYSESDGTEHEFITSRIAEFAAAGCGGGAVSAADFMMPLDDVLSQFDRGYESSKRQAKAAENYDAQMQAYVESSEAAIRDALKGVDVEKEPEKAERLANQAIQEHFQKNFKKLPGMSESIEEMDRLGVDPDKVLNFGSPGGKPYAYDRHDEKIDVLGASNRGYRARAEKTDVVARGFSGAYEGPKEMIAGEMKWIESLRKEGKDDVADEMEEVMRGRARRAAASIVAYERNGAKAPALEAEMLKATEETLGEKIGPTEEEIARVKFTPRSGAGPPAPGPATRNTHPIEERANTWGVPFMEKETAKKYGYAP